MPCLVHRKKRITQKLHPKDDLLLPTRSLVMTLMAMTFGRKRRHRKTNQLTQTWLWHRRRLRQSNEVTMPSKGRERHIGYGYFDYDSAEIGVDKGKAVVVGSDKGENPGHLTGLIIIPVGSAGEFRRVGIFHVHEGFYEDEEAPCCDIKSWLNTLLRSLR
ncbi:hypothetical protein BD769DRAFT_1509043 [Suillus cothurnatus]|nr:hypothetical protein BD769DRAFT_1509043 [Suillus cothurnatus]